MTTQTSIIAQQTRLRQWAEQIRECRNRPAGMDIQTWCSQKTLQKRITIIGSAECAKPAWISCRKVHRLLLRFPRNRQQQFRHQKRHLSERFLPANHPWPAYTENMGFQLTYIRVFPGICSDSSWRPLPMLNDASGFKKVYLATGYTDLRRGVDGLAGIIRFQFQLDPHDKNTLFLFCGRRSDRIKALLWEGDGFLLMYKRLDSGAFCWPRSADEALLISPEQYRMLMQGLEIQARHPIREISDPPDAM